MIYLRSFRPCDWQVLAQYQYPGIDHTEAAKLIEEFNAPTYQGKFHKLSAIVDDAQIVGYVSLIEQADGIASIGVEVYKPFRRRGYAYAAVLQMFMCSDFYGYRTVTGHVRKDNAPSLALCKKLGFTITNEGISQRGYPVYHLTKSI